jgi:hypothetical protein
MRFSTLVGAILALESIVDALPVPEIFSAGFSSSPYAKLIERGPTGGPSSSGAIPGSSSLGTTVGTTKKEVKLGGFSYNSMKYPSAPKLTKRPGADEIMTVYPKLHGAWISVPGDAILKKEPKAETNEVDGKSKPLSSFLAVTNTALVDHIVETQILSKFFSFLQDDSKWPLEKVQAIFLSNHDTDFSRDANKAKRSVAPDYSPNAYYGSLLQHSLLEFGSAEHLERLAVLNSGTNNRKGIVWKGENTSTEKGLETALDLMRIDKYMVDESEGFCATVDGVHQVLQKFRNGRKKAVAASTGSGKGSASGSQIRIRAGPKSNKGTNPTIGGASGSGGGSTGGSGGPPATPQKTVPLRTSDRKKQPPQKDPNQLDWSKAEDVLIDPTPQKYRETPLKQQTGDDKQYGQQVGTKEQSAKSEEKNWPPLGPPYDGPEDFNLDDLWVKFMRSEIKKFGSKLSTDLKQFTQLTDKNIVARRKEIESFKVASVDKLLACKSLKTSSTPIDKKLGKGTGHSPSSEDEADTSASKGKNVAPGGNSASGSGGPATAGTSSATGGSTVDPNTPTKKKGSKADKLKNILKSPFKGGKKKGGSS